MMQVGSSVLMNVMFQVGIERWTDGRMDCLFHDASDHVS
jgi:hypothetical protein